LYEAVMTIDLVAATFEVRMLNPPVKPLAGTVTFAGTPATAGSLLESAMKRSEGQPAILSLAEREQHLIASEKERVAVALRVIAHPRVRLTAILDEAERQPRLCGDRAVRTLGSCVATHRRSRRQHHDRDTGDRRNQMLPPGHTGLLRERLNRWLLRPGTRGRFRRRRYSIGVLRCRVQ
jgi:hypothetical protein